MSNPSFLFREKGIIITLSQVLVPGFNTRSVKGVLDLYLNERYDSTDGWCDELRRDLHERAGNNTQEKQA